MYGIERKEEILKILKDKKSCSVSELARLLHFSEATIRRDLTALDNEMKIHKTFGGAVILEKYNSEFPMSIRRKENEEAKQRICRVASSLLQDNMTIFLAASSTVEYILPYLDRFKGLTVITNSPDIPAKISNPNITVYSTGGKFLHHSNEYAGEFATNMIRQVNADMLFFSARGLSIDGRLTQTPFDAVQKEMIKNSAKSCLLLDSSKVDKTFEFTFARIQDIDVIVTDKKMPESIKHPNIIIADN